MRHIRMAEEVYYEAYQEGREGLILGISGWQRRFNIRHIRMAEEV
jgi:hypothetical protein